MKYTKNLYLLNGIFHNKEKPGSEKFTRVSGSEEDSIYVRQKDMRTYMEFKKNPELEMSFDWENNWMNWPEIITLRSQYA